MSEQEHVVILNLVLLPQRVHGLQRDTLHEAVFAPEYVAIYGLFEKGNRT